MIMTAPDLSALSASIARLDPISRTGRVVAIEKGTILVGGIQQWVAPGDQVQVETGLCGEVITTGPDHVSILPDGPVAGVRRGMSVVARHAVQLCPDPSWIGRVIDPDGRPLDGLPLISGVAPERRARPTAPQRGFGTRMETGVAALNTLLPLARGQRIGLFAGSGVGKSTLLGMLTRHVDAEVIVIGLVGERARELRDFVTDTLGPKGLSRAIVIAATAETAPQTRRRCAESATRVAEYFSDLGHHVLLLMDSLTRFAEAHREVAVASGERANLRGHPASTPAALAGLCERAGPGRFGRGDITAIYTVLVAGSDMEEPVADMVRGVLDGHIVLDRSIAERGRFPAIDVLRSVSRSLPGVASDAENALIQEARQSIAAYDRIAVMRQAGLYAEGADLQADAAVANHDALEKFLALTDGRPALGHFAALRQALSHGRTG